MPTFSVQFAAIDGSVKSQTLEANSERAALAQIEAGGFTPISVKAAQTGTTSSQPKAASTGAGAKTRKTKSGKAYRKALLDFTHQMTAVSESGIPIIAGLKAVAEQTGHSELKAGIVRVIGRIEGGRSFAEAIDAEPQLFPTLYVKTVAAGEAAGKIPEVLHALAHYQEQEAETRGAIKSALLYPFLVVITLVLASTFMLIFVVPQFALLFQKFEGQLPMPTKLLIGTSEAITKHYLFVLIALAAIVFSLKKLFRYQLAKEWLDHLFLRLPVFGNLLIGVYMVRLIELLDLLMQAALPIVQSLKITADSTINSAIACDVQNMVRSVEGGRSLTEAFSEARWLTPLVKRMLAIGEQSGRTDQIFSYLRKYYATQTKRSVKLLSTLIEPVMVISLAGVVLFFALAIFLPMWKLLKLIGTA
jgi:MSHA biogenesis protein MshG